MFKIRGSIIFFIIVFYGVFRIFGGKIPNIIFNVFFITFILSFLWVFYIKKKISGYQNFNDKDYYVGDFIEIKSIIDNDTLFPTPQIEVVDRSAEKLSEQKPITYVFSLMPLEREFTSEIIKLKYRGIYEIGPIDIKIKDFFNFFSLKTTIYSNLKLKVFPKVHNLDYFNLRSIQSYGTLKTLQKAYEDNTSISDIKKYTEGENFKRIHWKVTAKKGQLYIKNYDMTGSVSAYIFLDFKSNCYIGENQKELEEKAIEAVASIAAYLLRHSVSLNMYVNSNNIYYTCGRDTKNIKSFLDILCDITCSGSSSIVNIIESRIRFIKKGSSIIIVTGSMVDDDAEVYYKIKSMGYDLIIIYVSDYKIQYSLINQMRIYDIKIYEINSKSNIKRVLESI